MRLPTECTAPKCVHSSFHWVGSRAPGFTLNLTRSIFRRVREHNDEIYAMRLPAEAEVLDNISAAFM